jgi:hypothetical protein
MTSQKRSTRPGRRRPPARLPAARSGYSSHRLLEARSLAMHAVIAAKIEREPRLLNVALNNLKRWRARWKGDAPAWHHEWCEILRLSWPEIAAILTEPTEQGARLRQSSPFAGVLSATERRRVYEAFKVGRNASDVTIAASRREKWQRENGEAIAEYSNSVARSRTLAEFFAGSPLRGSGLKASRSKDHPRRRRIT